MSSVSKPKLGASWQANIRTADDKRINRATKVPLTLQLRGLAEQIAAFWDQIVKKSHCREDLEKQADMLSITITSRIKNTSEPVVLHFQKITNSLLESVFPKEKISSFREVSFQEL
jgi:hypothetical protein